MTMHKIVIRFLLSVFYVILTGMLLLEIVVAIAYILLRTLP